MNMKESSVRSGQAEAWKRNYYSQMLRLFVRLLSHLQSSEVTKLCLLKTLQCFEASTCFEVEGSSQFCGLDEGEHIYLWSSAR